jgi:hypothetical protein
VKLAHVPIAKLKPAGYNPRHISDEELESLVRSIREFGLVDPIVANKDHTIIGGHQRWRAAKIAGLETVPVVYVDLTKDKEKALNLALNRISGEWDEAKLRTLVDELAGDGFDLELTGFTNDELDWLNDRGEPWTVEAALKELDMAAAVKKPVWVVIRAPAEHAEQIAAALANLDALAAEGVSVDRSF